MTTQHESDPRALAIAEAMRADGQPELVTRAFLQAWRRVADGATGLMPESEITPVETLDDADALDDRADLEAAGAAALSGVAVIKLNGGLGTSMGMRGPKSLVEVREGWTFLDLVARQVLALRREHRADVPLLLMNSFATRAPSLQHLAKHEGLSCGLPADFLQHRVPKLRAADLSPVGGGDDAGWCPPGHGDLYAALQTSGLLPALLERGAHTLFVSNIDNLGATLDLALLGHFRRSGAPMMMEVADRTAADRKGGHLCRRRDDGSLLLRESAQCPVGDRGAFGDIGRHRYFNTNSLWFDVPALAAALRDAEGALPLAPIVNRKTLDPNDPDSLQVIQLESAMGAALSELPGAIAIRVPRDRFAPVKTTADLLVLRSDRYVVAPELGRLRRAVATSIDVELGPDYRTVEALDARFPDGVPSLREASRLVIEGDVTFGADIVVRGDVSITARGEGRAIIASGTALEGAVIVEPAAPPAT